MLPVGSVSSVGAVVGVCIVAVGLSTARGHGLHARSCRRLLLRSSVTHSLRRLADWLKAVLAALAGAAALPVAAHLAAAVAAAAAPAAVRLVTLKKSCRYGHYRVFPK